jgi:hypothetical protein
MKIIQLTFILFLSFISFEQEIYIRVKKGSATLDNEKLTYENGARQLSDKSKLTIETNSLVLVRQNKKLLQLKSVKTYKANQIVQLLSKKKELESSSYANVLFYARMQKPAPIQSGSVTRGGGDVNWNELSFSPVSNSYLLSDTLKLKVYNSGVLIGDTLELRSSDWNEPKFYRSQKDANFVLNGLKPGSYEWGINLTALDSTTEDKTFLLTGVIRIPDKVILDKMLSEEREFKKTITEFDEDIKLELLKEFYSNNKYIK